MSAKPVPTLGRKPDPRPRSILLSKRANIVYLEHARVLQKNDRVLYLTDRGEDFELFFNIPHQNTSLLLLGRGTSITDSAVRKLTEASVMIGFCGSGGTPIFGATDMVFMPGLSEYRPTEYMQMWSQKWFDSEKRLEMAKSLLKKRAHLVQELWRAPSVPQALVEDLVVSLDGQTDQTGLLLREASWTKHLYSLAASSEDLSGFTRISGRDVKPDSKKLKKDVRLDRANAFLDHGNYLAYGLAAVALYGLGVSFAMPVLHGKTRRGGLVFDIADPIKDAIVLPTAFRCAADPTVTEQIFRATLIQKFHEQDALDLAFDLVKNLITEVA